MKPTKEAPRRRTEQWPGILAPYYAGLRWLASRRVTRKRGAR